MRDIKSGRQLGTLFFCAAVLLHGAASQAIESRRTFESDVRPILRAHCFQCHGEDGAHKGQLDLRLAWLAIKGGKSGAAIVPGKPQASLLCTKITQGEMPKGKQRLSDREIRTITEWIEQGANTARPEPREVPAVYITEAERAFWSFQPILLPQVPEAPRSARIRTPLDAFVWQKLSEKGLSFSPEAERAVLVRRAYVNLLGLIPPPEEVDRFVHDDSRDAYERLIDRLLDSPHYGERWGRFWLDAAGYAESAGYNESDKPRPFAWKYRDYVIRSFNEDKPLDRFIREQLAGDEMVKRPFDDLSPSDQEKLIATGFLRMAPDGTDTGDANPKLAQNEAVAGVLKIVGSSLLGLTIGCAQCHDHRYDPIPQIDYYRFRAIFDPAFDMDHWRPPSQRLISVQPPDQRKIAREIEARAAVEDRRIAAEQQAALENVFEREILKVPEEQQEDVRAAHDTPRELRTRSQIALLRIYPSADVFRQLDLYDPPAYKQIQAERAEVAKLRATKPPEDAIEATTEVPGQVPKSRLFFRGDVEQPRQEVHPGELTVLVTNRPTADIPPKDSDLPTTGRRLAYARMLTDGTHPLVARVLVNRVWQHHFGAGIVATPGDFGSLGERPAHPELLDWLASDFTSHGWKLKRLHKLIMTSTVYRQSSLRRPELDAVDPENRLLGRFNLLRLDAEAVRDSVLAASGNLNDRMHGASVPVGEDRDGQVVVGRQKRNVNGEAIGVEAAGDDLFRRSIYIQVRRSKPLAMLETFDLPVMNPNCDLRRMSTVSPQALMLMNGSFLAEQSLAMAHRLQDEKPGDLPSQVRRGWSLLFGTQPRGEEVEQSLDFLSEQAADLQSRQPPAAKPGEKKPIVTLPDSQTLALASWCQALMSANRFLYVE
jgi:cytochrome c553